MTKNVWPAIFVVFALVVGVLAGAYLFPTTKTLTLEKPVPYEVVKNVSVEVPVEVPTDYITPAVSDLIAYLDDEDLLACDGTDYKPSEVSVLKNYDGYSVTFDKDEYEVETKVKLAFKESGEARCTDTFDFKVLYEEDEEPDVTIL